MREAVSANHADIGVDTGYVLNHDHYQPDELRLALIDLQQTVWLTPRDDSLALHRKCINAMP